MARKQTIKELQEIIKEKESRYYSRIAATDLDNVPNNFIEEMKRIDKLRPKSRSTKADYERYNRELQYALEWDVESPEGQRIAEEKEMDAFNSFNRNYSELLGEELSYQDWRDLVESFGTASESLREKFYKGGQGDGSLVAIYREVKMNTKGDKSPASLLVNAMNKINRKSKGMGWTPEDMIDELRNELKLDSKPKMR